MNEKQNEQAQLSQPIIGEFSNWTGVIDNELQTIIDFGFVQPSPENEPKVGVIVRRIILPREIAKQLGEILTKTFSYEKGTESTKKED
jgi:hypothetical protein